VAIHDLLCVGVSVQDLQKSLSSQGSPSISPAPFGSHVTTSSGADANSPALSQNSAPSSAPNDQSFHPSLGSGSLARQLARPAELDRVSSGYLEPGELLLLKKCCCSKSVAPKVLLLKKCCCSKSVVQKLLLLKECCCSKLLLLKMCCHAILQVCHACCCWPAFVSNQQETPCLLPWQEILPHSC